MLLRSLWEELKECKAPLLLIVGEKDEKFKSIACKMYSNLQTGVIHHEMVEVANSGHAVHLENPLPVIRAIRQFLATIKPNFTASS